MNQNSSSLAAFHLIGERSGIDTVDAGGKDLRPALFGAFRDLSKIRYDYPLVLVNAGIGEDCVKSLADIIDEILREIAPRGVEGETLRRQVLCLEQEIRDLVAGGSAGLLSQLWEKARQNIEPPAGGELDDKLLVARRALKYDGEVIDCDNRLSTRLVAHLWSASQQLKANRLRVRVEYLAQKLSDILRVDFMYSRVARDARHLKGSVGTADQTVFDFKAMSRILRTAPVGGPLPKTRQRRIRDAITALESQQFVATKADKSKTGPDRHGFDFEFEDCGEAVAAFRERLPEMAALVKAISIAELEIGNRYDESKHNPFFDHFDEILLGPQDIAMFPSYLVCLANKTDTASGRAAVLEVLCCGLPIKIVAQSDDILNDISIASGQMSFGLRGQQLAKMALGLSNVFVLQSSASSLYRLRQLVFGGLAGDRPALFSVFSGAIESAVGIAPYLGGAAATGSRAFPCFVYDPCAGSDWASRFSLVGNPQAKIDWPSHMLDYENAEHKSLSEHTALTLVDFISSDRRHAGLFACVPKSDWHDHMLPVATFLEMGSEVSADIVPYTWLIDENNRLHRAVVDHRLIDAARCCRDLWRGLQELGGINNSHAATALVEAEREWQKEKQQLLARPVDQVQAAGATPAQPEATGPGLAVAPQSPTQAPAAEGPLDDTPNPSPDDPWIETIRCTTCNECTELNNRMFVYDDDMRAYIADPDAGTYRQLVEAAETCQVAIIHPGKPRNQNESGLEQLIGRAEPFNA
jgi:hypothetical protein